jgi:hypothetical protein
MKKLVVSLLLAVVLVAPAFAKDMELIPKVGYLFTPEVTVDVDGKNASSSSDSAFCTGLELFFDMDNNFFLGFGVMWGQNHKFNSVSANKIGFTNIYGELKYKFLVNISQNDSLFIYPLVQLGFGAPGWEYNGYHLNYTIEGLGYWGLGAGCEYKNIIFELIYGCDYAVEKYIQSDHRDFKNDITYTAFRINIGYKFDL